MRRTAHRIPRLPVAVAAAAMLCLAGCGAGQDETPAATEETAATMGKEETLAAIQEESGLDLSDYAEDAYGSRDGSYASADVTVREGCEEQVEQAIVATCGKGSPASSRKRPFVDDSIADSFSKAELLDVYDCMRTAEENPHATLSVVMYTATVDGRFHVFVV